MNGVSEAGGGILVRSIWRGAIGFGLVHIPCRLYPAAVDRDVHFRLLHRTCHTPVRNRRVCPHCDRALEPEEIVRGYEVAPETFVEVEDEDFDELPGPSARRTVAILNFVSLSEVDPMYFDRPYLLGPEEGGGRPYGLLREALRRTDRAAVARFALRARDHLALVRVVGPTLVLETMRYPDELASVEGFEHLPTDSVDTRELDLAAELIERRSAPWEPQRYRDTYRETLADRLAQRGAAGRVAAQAPQGYAGLLAALEASLQADAGEAP